MQAGSLAGIIVAVIGAVAIISAIETWILIRKQIGRTTSPTGTSEGSFRKAELDAARPWDGDRKWGAEELGEIELHEIDPERVIHEMDGRDMRERPWI